MSDRWNQRCEIGSMRNHERDSRPRDYTCYCRAGEIESGDVFSRVQRRRYCDYICLGCRVSGSNRISYRTCEIVRCGPAYLRSSAHCHRCASSSKGCRKRCNIRCEWNSDSDIRSSDNTCCRRAGETEGGNILRGEGGIHQSPHAEICNVVLGYAVVNKIMTVKAHICPCAVCITVQHQVCLDNTCGDVSEGIAQGQVHIQAAVYSRVNINIERQLTGSGGDACRGRIVTSDGDQPRIIAACRILNRDSA